MKLKGRVYVEVDWHDVQPGDYVILPGRRVRKVASVREHEGGRVTLGLEALRSGGMVLARAQRIGAGEIESAWRWHRDASQGETDDG